MLYLHDVCFNEDLLRILSHAAGLVSGLLFLFIVIRTAAGQSRVGSRDYVLNILLLTGLTLVSYMARFRLSFNSIDRIQVS